MLKIYLAGASSELERCGRIMDALIAMPHVEVTHNWVEGIRKVRASGITSDGLLSREDARTYADADRQGIRDANIFWQAVPEKGTYSHGAFWELGYAQCLSDVYDGRRQIILSREAGCPQSRVAMSIFHQLAGGRSELMLTDSVMLRWLENESA